MGLKKLQTSIPEENNVEEELGTANDYIEQQTVRDGPTKQNPI